MPNNPYDVYKQQSILTMTQGEMLNKLFEEIVKQLSCAQLYIEEKDVGKANQALQKAQRILNHLRATLDFQYDVSNNLAALYDFFIQKIIQANIKKDAGPIQEILPMIQDLQATFIQADKIARTQK